MKHDKCCNNCDRGAPLHLTKDILCKYRGVVTPDYVCHRYKELCSSKKQIQYNCTHCEYFLVNLNQEDENIGQCKMFSAREFDGRSRNACTKFSRKLLIEVC